MTFILIGQDEDAEFTDDLANDVVSLSSSVLDYEYENGRRYNSNRMVRAIELNSSFRVLIFSPRANICNCVHPFYLGRAEEEPVQLTTNPFRLPNDEEEQDRMDLV